VHLNTEFTDFSNQINSCIHVFDKDNFNSYFPFHKTWQNYVLPSGPVQFNKTAALS